MRIAICDDDKKDIVRIQSAMLGIQDNYQVDTFESGRQFLDALQDGRVYDLLFCDIYLHDENGIDLVKEMQNISPNTAIVFTTSSTEHAVEAFSIRALHYLVKPIKQEDVIEVFRRLEKKVEPRHTLTIRIDRTVNVLFQDEIVRVESHGHNTVITYANNTVYSIRKPFWEINGMLDESFIRIKKGVTLNMRFITKMTYVDCMTRDGVSYLLRRDWAKSIREKYYEFVRNEMNKL